MSLHYTRRAKRLLQQNGDSSGIADEPQQRSNKMPRHWVAPTTTTKKNDSNNHDSSNNQQKDDTTLHFILAPVTPKTITTFSYCFKIIKRLCFKHKIL